MHGKRKNETFPDESEGSNFTFSHYQSMPNDTGIVCDLQEVFSIPALHMGVA